jgi:hypothetical protein
MVLPSDIAATLHLQYLLSEGSLYTQYTPPWEGMGTPPLLSPDRHEVFMRLIHSCHPNRPRGVVPLTHAGTWPAT